MAKILVVEDEENIRETLVDILEAYDYEVVEAKNGLIGSIKAVKEKPDLIISDVNMPEMDGFEMLEALNGCMDKVLMPPFIFLTAKVEREDMRQGMNLGADDYITKPYNTKELLQAVETKLAKRKDVEDKILSMERSNISSELHDSIQQLLVASYMGFEGIKDKISLLDPSDQVVFKSAFGLLNQANNDLRNYAHNIGKKEEIENIEQSLINMVNSLNNSGNVKFNLKHYLDHPIDSNVQTQLYRITQEAVSNLLKYAKAKTASIQIKSNKDQINLNISDDGIGFDFASIEGMGMSNMKKRAKDMGAEIQINSNPGEGTSVELSLKL